MNGPAGIRISGIESSSLKRKAGPSAVSVCSGFLIAVLKVGRIGVGGSGSVIFIATDDGVAWSSGGLKKLG